MKYSKILSFVSILFFIFILWIIYLANTGQSSIFFTFVASVPYGDKIGHFFIFGLLTLGANILFKLKTFRLYKLNIYFGSVFVLLFALCEELSQYFLASRTLDLFDFLADLLGVFIFSLLTHSLRKCMDKS
jgi:VanZ family protein